MEILEKQTPLLIDKTLVSQIEDIDPINIDSNFVRRSNPSLYKEDDHLDVDSDYVKKTSPGGQTYNLNQESPSYLFPCVETMDQQVNPNIIDSINLDKIMTKFNEQVRPLTSVRPKQNLNNITNKFLHSPSLQPVLPNYKMSNNFQSLSSPHIPLAIKNKGLPSLINLKYLKNTNDKNSNPFLPQNRGHKSPSVCQYCFRKYHNELGCWLLEARLRDPKAQYCLQCKRKGHSRHQCLAHPMEGITIDPKNKITHKNCTYCDQTFYKYKRPFLYNSYLNNSAKAHPPVASNSKCNSGAYALPTSHQTRHDMFKTSLHNNYGSSPAYKTDYYYNSKFAQDHQGQKSVIICSRCLFPNHLASTCLAQTWERPGQASPFNKNKKSGNFENIGQSKNSNFLNNKKHLKNQSKFVNDQTKKFHNKKESCKLQNILSKNVAPVLQVQNSRIHETVKGPGTVQATVHPVLSGKGPIKVSKISSVQVSNHLTMSSSLDKIMPKNSVIINNMAKGPNDNVVNRAGSIQNVEKLATLCLQIIQVHKLDIPTTESNKVKDSSIEILNKIDNTVINKNISPTLRADIIPELSQFKPSSTSLTKTSDSNIIMKKANCTSEQNDRVPINEINKSSTQKYVQLDKTVSLPKQKFLKKGEGKLSYQRSHSNELSKHKKTKAPKFKAHRISILSQIKNNFRANKSCENINIFESPSIKVAVKSNVPISPSDKKDNESIVQNIGVNNTQLNKQQSKLIKNSQLGATANVVNKNENLNEILGEPCTVYKPINESNLVIESFKYGENDTDTISSVPNQSVHNNEEMVSASQSIETNTGGSKIYVNKSPSKKSQSLECNSPEKRIVEGKPLNKHKKGSGPQINMPEIKTESVQLVKNKIDVNTIVISETSNEILSEGQSANKVALQSDKSGNVNKIIMQNNSVDVANEEIGSTASELMNHDQINSQGTSNKKTKKKKNRSDTFSESSDQGSTFENNTKSKHHFDMAGTVKLMKTIYDHDWNFRPVEHPGKIYALSPDYLVEIARGPMIPLLEQVDNGCKIGGEAVSLHIELAQEIEQNPTKYGFVLREKYKSYWEMVKSNEIIMPPLCFLHAYSCLRCMTICLYHGDPQRPLFFDCSKPYSGMFYMELINNTWYRLMKTDPDLPSKLPPHSGILYKIHNVKIQGTELIVKDHDNPQSYVTVNP